MEGGGFEPERAWHTSSGLSERHSSGASPAPSPWTCVCLGGARDSWRPRKYWRRFWWRRRRCWRGPRRRRWWSRSVRAFPSRAHFDLGGGGPRTAARRPAAAPLSRAHGAPPPQRDPVRMGVARPPAPHLSAPGHSRPPRGPFFPLRQSVDGRSIDRFERPFPPARPRMQRWPPAEAGLCLRAASRQSASRRPPGALGPGRKAAYFEHQRELKFGDGLLPLDGSIAELPYPIAYFPLSEGAGATTLASAPWLDQQQSGSSGAALYGGTFSGAAWVTDPTFGSALLCHRDVRLFSGSLLSSPSYGVRDSNCKAYRIR